MNEKTIQVDKKRALQTLLVAIEAETGVMETDDLPDEPGDEWIWWKSVLLAPMPL